jgi:4-amino-4-deoxy-L-arabinose transferase-like glycosyltransferase
MMENKKIWFFGNKISLLITLVIVFVAAIGIRLYDLTDMPLDFNANRQLFSALKARGMYYAMLPASAADVPHWQREMAISQWKSLATIEPPVTETLVALTYRVFGLHLWISRIYTSLFWVLGGIFLFLLAKEISSLDGAVVALLFYLLLPFGIIASRSFQPDPLMVFLMIAGLWAMYRWRSSGTWKWALTAGLLSGAAIFVKNVAVFPLLGAAIGLVLERGLRESIKDRQTWILAVLAILPVGLYTLYGVLISGSLASQFNLRFFPDLWKDGGFYIRWKGQLDGITGFGPIVLALIGVLLAGKRKSAFLLGLWAGYLVFGMTFAYHISTHDYYSLPVIPIVALSFSPLVDLLVDRLEQVQPAWLVRTSLAVFTILICGVYMWYARVDLARSDYREDPQFWWKLGEKLGHTNPAIGLTQDYGARLAYWGWQDISSWYYSGDLNIRDLAGINVNLSDRFADQIKGKKFFVVTQMSKLDLQPEIKATLYKHYTIYDQGNGYVIFDLTHPK